MLHEMQADRAAEPSDTGVGGRRVSDSRFQGSLDVVQSTRLAGWAMDQEAPEAAVVVEIVLETEVIGKVAADRLRKDLEKAGIGTGRYGFEMIPVRPLAEQDLARLAVRVRSADGVFASIPNRAAVAHKATSGEGAMVAGELKELRAAVGRLGQSLGPVGERLAERMDAIDVAQARLDASVARIERALEQRLGRGGRGIGTAVSLLSAIAILSLGLGIVSLWTH